MEDAFILQQHHHYNLRKELFDAASNCSFVSDSIRHQNHLGLMIDPKVLAYSFSLDVVSDLVTSADAYIAQRCLRRAVYGPNLIPTC